MYCISYKISDVLLHNNNKTENSDEHFQGPAASWCPLKYLPRLRQCTRARVSECLFSIIVFRLLSSVRSLCPQTYEASNLRLVSLFKSTIRLFRKETTNLICTFFLFNEQLIIDRTHSTQTAENQSSLSGSKRGQKFAVAKSREVPV